MNLGPGNVRYPEDNIVIALVRDNIDIALAHVRRRFALPYKGGCVG